MIRRAFVESPASELRRNVLTYLDIFLETARDGQREEFLCRDSAPYLSDKTIADLWKALSEA